MSLLATLIEVPCFAGWLRTGADDEQLLWEWPTNIPRDFRTFADFLRRRRMCLCEIIPKADWFFEDSWDYTTCEVPRTERLPARLLTLNPPSRSSEGPWPVITIKVNFPETGGMILGLSFHRSTNDLYSAAKFVRILASHCGEEVITIRDDIDPIIDRIDVMRMPEVTSPPPDIGRKFLQYLPKGNIRPEGPLARTQSFQFEAEDIQNTLRQVVGLLRHHNHESTANSMTGRDVICALMWCAVTRSRFHRLERAQKLDITKFSMLIDLRHRLTFCGSLHDYMGNLSGHAVAECRAADLISTFWDEPEGERAPREGDILSEDITLADIAHAAWRIRTAIDAVDATYARDLLHYLELNAAPVRQWQYAHSIDSANTDVNFVDWSDFGPDIQFKLPGTTSREATWCSLAWPLRPGTCSILPRRPEGPWHVIVAMDAIDRVSMKQIHGLSHWESITDSKMNPSSDEYDSSPDIPSAV